MIQKLISGGQTGAERAALDVALELNIPHGGWIPKGRKTEKGRLPVRYRLNEISSIDYLKSRELNVLDSDGTLIISHGVLAGVPAQVQGLARKHRRPCLHIDLTEMALSQAASVLGSWIDVRDIKTLNVDGCRASKDPNLYDATKTLLKAVMNRYLPQTVEDAVERLISDIPMKDKSALANLQEKDLYLLRSSVGVYIRRQFGLLSGNRALIASCGSISGDEGLNGLQASDIIIHELWKRLQKSHALRLVK